VPPTTFGATGLFDSQHLAPARRHRATIPAGCTTARLRHHPKGLHRKGGASRTSLSIAHGSSSSPIGGFARFAGLARFPGPERRTNPVIAAARQRSSVRDADPAASLRLGHWDSGFRYCVSKIQGRPPRLLMTEADGASRPIGSLLPTPRCELAIGCPSDPDRGNQPARRPRSSGVLRVRGAGLWIDLGPDERRSGGAEFSEHPLHISRHRQPAGHRGPVRNCQAPPEPGCDQRPPLRTPQYDVPSQGSSDEH
jgi:hypothetical protein